MVIVAAPVRAVIFVPESGDIVATARCLEHCQSRGYDVAGVVRGDWPAVVDMVRDSVAAVVIASRREHIDPTWTPRIEFVGDDPPAAAPAGRMPPRRRRPRRIA
jgi:hypothetical protein